MIGSLLVPKKLKLCVIKKIKLIQVFLILKNKLAVVVKKHYFI